MLHGVGQHVVEITNALGILFVAADLVIIGQFLHELGQGFAIALLEGSAAALAMVGQDDEMVGTGRLFGGGLQASELLVDFE